MAGRSSTSTNTPAIDKVNPLDGTTGAIGTARCHELGFTDDDRRRRPALRRGRIVGHGDRRGSWMDDAVRPSRATARRTDSRRLRDHIRRLRRRTARSWVMRLVAFRPASSDTTAPSIPTHLSGNGFSATQINLDWVASTDNVGVTGYKVFRDGSQVATSTTTTYQDTGLTPATTYTYTVSAYDAAGNESAKSASATATTQAAPGDTTPPTVSLTAPTAGSTVSGTHDRVGQRERQRRRGGRALPPRRGRHHGRGHHRALRRVVGDHDGHERHAHAHGARPRCGGQRDDVVPGDRDGLEHDAAPGRHRRRLRIRRRERHERRRRLGSRDHWDAHQWADLGRRAVRRRDRPRWRR